MVIPELFDVIEAKVVSKWREEIEKTDDCLTMQAPQKDKEALTAQLSDEQKKLLHSFEWDMINKMDYIYYEICKHLFYFGLKAGMDIQAVLSEE